MQRPLPDITQHSHKTNFHVPGGIGTHNPSNRVATGIGKIVINNNKSQNKRADDPARTSHKYENMNSTYYALLVLQPWFIVLEHFSFTSRALCQYTSSLYLSNLNSAYVLHGIHQSKKRQVVAKPTALWTTATGQKDPADYSLWPKCFVI
jgi:hypothetical protein